eukprot:CAMPEP_0167817904 /NCGR_PEP_ID=MMETSP0112_2-20121227/4496_1 /TAXON_ID=91324 /ORGANISM="Lotharella globosa, Strain CCCM811" /LENGTH=1033 /DNA_ID=CAMNT_0007717805 /DNA_START=112 /DNA_END=3213 /DNA_ORIENTATION=-
MASFLRALVASCLLLSSAVGGSVRTEGRIWTLATLAGGDAEGSTDGPGATARFHKPGGLVSTPDFNTFFIADTYNHCIRKLTRSGSGATNVQVTLFAGNCDAHLGQGMVDGIWQNARFNYPRGLAYEPNSSTLYIADTENHAIRMMDINVRVSTTLAGDRLNPGLRDGTGSHAGFQNPWGLTVGTSASGYSGLLVADRHNHAIRYVKSNGETTTVVQSYHAPGNSDGVFANATVTYPSDIQEAANGDVYFIQSHSLRKIPAGQTSLITISGASSNDWIDGALTSARFFDPRGLWVDSNGNAYITDKSHSRLRYVNQMVGDTATLIGNQATVSTNIDGVTSNATINQPTAVWGVHVATPEQTIVLADGDFNRIKEFTALCPHTCQNNGNCSFTDKCNCTEGWTSKDCSQPLCTTSCTNGKICVAPNTCQCPQGYNGTNCLTPVCDPQCAHGVCSSPDNCTCQHGWSDLACDFPICNQRCYNGANCTAPDTCTCTHQWNGTTCEVPICTLECRHNATCYAPDSCNCTEAVPIGKWTGIDCSIPLCNPTCKNNGTCVGPDQCQCMSGWEGPTCEVPICNQTCLNNGNCTAPNYCDCEGLGWEGSACQTPICDLYSCSNGATCIAPNTCNCTDGWMGTNCTVPICRNPNCTSGEICHLPETCITACSQNCTNGGYCSDINTCTCVNEWEGHDCSQAFCRRHGCFRGDCNTPNNCTCSDGWNGTACDIPICDEVTCLNGATCVAPNLCACVGDWVGRNCETPLCLYPWRPPEYFRNSTSDCANGVCYSPSNCTCSAGWYGPFCDLAVCTKTCLNKGKCTAPETCTCVGDWTGPICATSTAVEPTWLEANWYRLFPAIVVAGIIVGMCLLWRARQLKDHLTRVVYQVEYDKKHRPNAQDYITDSSSSSVTEPSRAENVEPTPQVVNKWTVGADALRDDAKRALQTVVIDEADETSSTALSSSVDEDGYVQAQTVQKRTSIVNMFNKFKTKVKAGDDDTPTSSSSENSAVLPGAVNRGNGYRPAQQMARDISMSSDSSDS